MDKQCPRCLEVRPTSDFGSNRSRFDGLKHICKVCETQNQPTQVHNSLENVVKTCVNCERTLSSRAFSYNQRYPDKLTPKCRSCGQWRGKLSPSLAQVLAFETSMRRIYDEISYDPTIDRVLFERQVLYLMEDYGLDVEWNPPVWVNKQIHGLTGKGSK